MTKRKKKKADRKTLKASRTRRTSTKRPAHRAKSSAGPKPPMTLDTTLYQRYRDELGDLLEQARKLPRLLPESASKIELVRRKLYENQFEITLVGEFQGGKSTTFNSICDGREISPRGRRGGGLKTSGCIIRAQNLADPNDDEHAIVHWRTPQELLMGFDGILRSALADQALCDADKDESTIHQLQEEMLKTFDPTSPDGQAKIRKAVEAEIKKWDSNRAFYDPDGLGRVDLIRFALLTAHFFDHPVIRSLTGKTRFAVSDVQRLVTFPEDWETRWAEWKPEVFTAEELAFAFVASVECRLHSPNLARLGCALTDCPGLFASAWDTRVAQQAVSRADAILYLLSGDKTLTLSDLQWLRSIALRKGLIFVGANCKTQSWEAATKVLDANRSLLTNQGLDIKPENIRLFHAALALLSRQIGRGVESLDQPTLDTLKSDLCLQPSDGPEAVRHKVQRKIERFLENLEPAYEGSGDRYTPSESYNISRIPSLLDAVERFVVTKKGRAILVGNAERILSALSETEGSLRQLESSVSLDVAEREREFKAAEAALGEFETEAEQLVKDFGNDAPNLLAASFWEHVDSDKDAFVAEVSTVLSRQIKKLPLGSLISFLFKSKTTFPMLTDIAKDRFQRWLERRAQSWIAIIAQGEEPSYNSTIRRPMASIHRDFNKHWDAISKKEIPALESIEIPVLDAMAPGSGVALPDDFVKSIGQIGESAALAGVITMSAFCIALILVILAIAGVVAPPVLALLAPLILIPKVKADILNGGEARVRKRLAEEFSKLKTPLCRDVSGKVNTLVDTLKSRLNNEVISHPRKIYVARKAAMQDQFQRAEGERINVANEAKSIRRRQIAPLRSECDSFLKKVKPLFEKIEA